MHDIFQCLHSFLQPVIKLEDLTPEIQENTVTIFIDGYEKVK